MPFAGLAFLWFIGVLRNRMGASEDQFFGTVSPGSGLLFVASLFAATTIAGAVLGSLHARPDQQVSSDVYYFARQVAYSFLNIFGVKMAGVLIFSTCVIALRTGILPTLDCIFRIRLRADPSACHLELDVDRDAVSPVDDIGERAYSPRAEKIG